MKTLFLATLTSVTLFTLHVSGAATMVSNLGQTDSTLFTVEGSSWLAQRFVTDNSAPSFDLVSVVLQMGAPANTGSSITVALRESTGNQPGDFIQNLSGPTTPGAGDQTFTPSLPLTLNPNTSYWIVAEVLAGTGSYSWVTTPTTSATGPWSISATDTKSYSTNFGTSWTNQDGHPYKFSVNAVPEPTGVTLLLLAAGGAFIATGLRKVRND